MTNTKLADAAFDAAELLRAFLSHQTVTSDQYRRVLARLQAAFAAHNAEQAQAPTSQTLYCAALIGDGRRVWRTSRPTTRLAVAEACRNDWAKHVDALKAVVLTLDAMPRHAPVEQAAQAVPAERGADIEHSLRVLRNTWDYCDDVVRNGRTFGATPGFMRAFSDAITAVEDMAQSQQTAGKPCEHCPRRAAPAPAPEAAQAVPAGHVAWVVSKPGGYKDVGYQSSVLNKLPHGTLLYAKPQPAAGSFMTREQAIAHCRERRPDIEPTEQHIAATIDAYTALFGDLAPAAPAPEAQPQAQAAGQELPPLPEPYTKAGRELAPTFQPLFSREQMHAYARAALAQRHSPFAPLRVVVERVGGEQLQITGRYEVDGQDTVFVALAQRQPLTDERIDDLAEPFVRDLGGDHWYSGERGIRDDSDIRDFARAIEAAHGIGGATTGEQP